jgi:hypothetical protein
MSPTTAQSTSFRVSMGNKNSDSDKFLELIRKTREHRKTQQINLKDRAIKKESYREIIP